jgi:F-type H+-transporting ATPase subunit alpha
MQNGHLDDIEVEKIKDCQEKFSEFLESRKDSLLAKIRDEKVLSDEINEELGQAVADFKSSYKG